MSGDRHVLLGRVVGVFGFQGWIKLESWTDPREAIFDYQPWELRSADGVRVFGEITGRKQGKGIIARFPGIDDVEAARALIGSDIFVPRAALPPPEAGEYYWSDLEGLEVRVKDGASLGRVSHLVATGANDVLVVHGERERLIPFLIDSVVTRIDLDGGVIEVDWDPDF